MHNVIFDFDGTLFMTDSIEVEAINSALTDMGKDRLDREIILSCIGHHMDKFSEICLETKDPETIDTFKKLALKHELKIIPNKGSLYPYCEELLESLKEKGFDLAICSNAGEPYLKRLMDKFDIRRHFTAVWHKRYGYSKKRGAALVRRKMGGAKKTFFVGDRKEDIEAANHNGFISIGVLHGFGEKDELGEADHLAHSLKEVYEIVTKDLPDAG